MSIDNYISLNVVIDRVMRLPEMNDLPYDVAIDATTDTIRQIANPLFLMDDDIYIDIQEYRGLLPVNYVNIIKAVRVNDSNTDNSRSSMLHNSDPFYKSYSNRDTNQILPEKYKIQGDYIYTNFKEGKLHVAFQLVPTDFDGTVMIPDRVSIVKAIEFSIMAEWLRNKWVANKISGDKFDYADRQRNWYISQTAADFMLENLDKRQSLSNTINTLITNTEHNVDDFRQLGSKEYRRNII